MKYLLSVVVSMLIFMISCTNPVRTWVTIDPIQCMGNSWEQDWLEDNAEDYDLWNELDVSGRESVFINYYENQGIIIHEMKTSYPYDAVCLACICPRGDRIHCSVDDDDVDKMLELGFSVE